MGIKDLWHVCPSYCGLRIPWLTSKIYTQTIKLAEEPVSLMGLAVKEGFKRDELTGRCTLFRLGVDVRWVAGNGISRLYGG